MTAAGLPDPCPECDRLESSRARCTSNIEGCFRQAWELVLHFEASAHSPGNGCLGPIRWRRCDPGDCWMNIVRRISAQS